MFWLHIFGLGSSWMSPDGLITQGCVNQAAKVRDIQSPGSHGGIGKPRNCHDTEIYLMDIAFGSCLAQESLLVGQARFSCLLTTPEPLSILGELLGVVPDNQHTCSSRIIGGGLLIRMKAF